VRRDGRSVGGDEGVGKARWWGDVGGALVGCKVGSKLA
jgi:hypothetical protein